jgi:hypothetical protein
LLADTCQTLISGEETVFLFCVFCRPEKSNPMHLVGDDQRRPRKERTTAERMFKRINSVILALQFTCLLIAMATAFIAGGNTFSGDMWFGTEYGLELVLQTKTENCSYATRDERWGYLSTPMAITSANQGLFFVTLASSVRSEMITAFLAFIVGAINKLIYDLNVFEKDIKRMTLHKECLSVIELVFLGMTINSNSGLETKAAPLRPYLKHCGITNERSLPFHAPFVTLYVSSAVVLFMHAVTLCLMVSNAVSSKFNKKKAQDEAPLE